MRISFGMVAVLLVATTTAAQAQTSITNVSPPNVRIQAGGYAAKLTLEGVALDKITSVNIVDGGRAVRGLTGAISTLGPTNTQLTIDLTANASVPPGTYQLAVLAGRQTLRISIPVTVEAARDESASVTTATPATINLLAGGPSQTITLNGSNLDKVRGAYAARNGNRVDGISGTLQPTTDPSRLVIQMQAGTQVAGSPWDVPLELVVAGPVSAPGAPTQNGPVATPATVKVLGTVRADDVRFRHAVKIVVDDASASFNSCGGSAGDRRFSLSLPGAPYSASGAEPRREHDTTVGERITFLEDHTLDGTDFFTGEIRGLFTSAVHPSPIPHTITQIRMCLEPLEPSGWVVTSAANGAVPEMIVTVSFPTTRFRTRGMPADATGTISGLNVGILWGSPVTDNEFPDWIFPSPKFEVRLPLEVSNGQIRYGSPVITRQSQPGSWQASIVPVTSGQPPGMWLGSSNVRTQFENFGNQRMDHVGQEIRKAFEAAQTRNKISAEILSRLQSLDVTTIIGVQRGGDGSLLFVHR